MTDIPIRPASTLIILRNLASEPQVLMGQRGSKAAFMPNKFVFPGGAVDTADSTIPLAQPLTDKCHASLQQDSTGPKPETLAIAAIRELWEETGLILGAREPWNDAPEDWRGFADAGFRPTAKNMYFFFRAITPPGPSRRFDARFFLVNADQLSGDLDDFSNASDELSHLQWVSLNEARSLNLPFITSVVLGELSGLSEINAPISVPFFKNQDEESLFLRLHGSQQ
ncbi:MAG: NUDIX hydrolase [Planktomarina sp.]|jgi:8-oxo-dGTP pyrophosphatase MutT (NUDIX family)|nr:NUDIX hydrolase [Planktomarina sp.]MDT2057340.1 NUDIX hydrolase [Planktomarina sp.]MDT2073405.1 NUDIX hydrolase [Planktomarina sp.]MDT2077128.1 NUDIX hydrolase [Planktomarina sp.]